MPKLRVAGEAQPKPLAQGRQAGAEPVADPARRSTRRLDGVADAGGEPVTRLHKRLSGQSKIVLRHRHLVGRRPNVEKGGPNLVLDLAAEIG